MKRISIILSLVLLITTVFTSAVSAETLASVDADPQAVPQWVYDDYPFAGTNPAEYSDHYMRIDHTVKFNSPIKSLSKTVIANGIILELGIPSPYAKLIRTLTTISNVAATLKTMASPYAMEADVVEHIYKIPGDWEIRYKHYVSYYDENGAYIDTTIYYSMFI
ncbi:MAG: hypothetical protein WC977_00330 [Anaerovoracaceae bacterium]